MAYFGKHREGCPGHVCDGWVAVLCAWVLGLGDRRRVR